MDVRKYQENDKETLRAICIVTAGSPVAPRKIDALLTLYCNYYLAHEPQNCFVLLGNNQPVGYILTSSDFARYEKTFREDYMPRLKKTSFMQFGLKKLSFVLEKYLTKRYPAHLHIDILPDFTGHGEGGKLMQSALNHLREQSVKGVFLCVSAKNVNARKFYLRHGFTTVLRIPSAIFMARTLASD